VDGAALDLAARPARAYTGANVLFRSTNEGQSWTAISPDLTRPIRDAGRLGRVDHTRPDDRPSIYATIFALAESPRVKGLIWTGSDDGLIQVTRDGGKTWTNVTPLDVAHVHAHLEHRSVALRAGHCVSRGQPVPAPRTAHPTSTGPPLRENVDQDRDGIPATDFVRVVREDPVRRGSLFAGTERGVWVSFDDGANWQSLRTNLPIVPGARPGHQRGGPRGGHPRALVSGFLDDIAPLRELVRATCRAKPRTSSSRATLPRRLVGAVSPSRRTRPTRCGRTRPTAPMIYSLVEGQGPAVTLDILDAVRSRRAQLHEPAGLAHRGGQRARRQRENASARTVLKQAGVRTSVKIDSIVSDTPEGHGQAVAPAPAGRAPDGETSRA